MALVFVVVGVLGIGGAAGATGVDTDRVRGLLYRIDGEAHAVFLHPEAARDEADAANRFAQQAAGRLAGVPALAPQVEGLRRAAETMRTAARQAESSIARDAALELAVRVRALDDSLPPR